MMELTDEHKKHIDAMSYEGLLGRWRGAPAGDPWFQGETGQYWEKRMDYMKARDPSGAVRASKSLG